MGGGGEWGGKNPLLYVKSLLSLQWAASEPGGTRV